MGVSTKSSMVNVDIETNATKKTIRGSTVTTKRKNEMLPLNGTFLTVKKRKCENGGWMRGSFFLSLDPLKMEAT